MKNQCKRIHISHIPNTFNYGSAMMAIALIDNLNKMYKNDKLFLVDASTEEDLQRLQYSTNLSNIDILPVEKFVFEKPSNWKNMQKWQKATYVPSILRKWRQRQDFLINNSDLEIVLGGDDLSEYYGVRGVVFELGRLNYIAKRIPLVLLGQTVGPFAPSRQKLAKICLRKATLFTRDDLSYKYCRYNLHFKNVFKGRDLAFLDLPKQNNKCEIERLMTKYSLKPDTYVTIVASGLVGHYTERREDFIRNFVKLLEELSGKTNIQKIVFLAHVLRPISGDDRIVIREILDYIKDQNLLHVIEKLVVVDNELFPYEARIILGYGRFTVSGRMHAAVSTFQMGKPAIALSYSMKYEGVISEGLNVPMLVVDALGTNKWKNLQIADEVIRRVNYIESNNLGICQRIRRGVKNSQELALSPIKQIVNSLSK